MPATRKSRPWRLADHTGARVEEYFFTSERDVFGAIPRGVGFRGSVYRWDGYRWELFELVDAMFLGEG